jgi:hypothetical protein
MQTSHSEIRDSSKVILMGTIRYNLLITLLTRMTRDLPNACLGGLVEITIQGNPNETTKNQKIVKRVMSHRIMQQQLQPDECSKTRLHYYPVIISWCPDDHDDDNHNKQQQQQCSGHAVALIINRDTHTAEYFEPNGSHVPWFQPVSHTLERLLKKSKWYGPEYRMQQYDPESCPRVGIQGIAGEAQCAYFSSLYVMLRLSCPQLSAANIHTALLGSGPAYLRYLLQQWHCYLVDYIETSSPVIRIAYENIAPLYSSVLLKIATTKGMLEQQQEQLKHQLRLAERVATFDLVTAFSILTRLYNKTD